MTFEVEYEKKTLDLTLLSGEPKAANEALTIIELFSSSHGNLTYEISSPSFPYNYPAMANYAWLIRTNHTDQQVHFQLKELNIEKCCDQLAVYDGSSRSGQVIAVMSGVIKTRPVFLSTTKALFIRFTSDCSVNRKGFSGQIQSISYIP